MLYEKCKVLLGDDISMKISHLDTIRCVLALADENCKKLTLLDIENLWKQFENWHDRGIPVENSWMKRYMKWICRDVISTAELQEIYVGIDKLFDSKE